MKICELHLIAFGPFTDHRMQFASDGVLHIVFGPNEGGKSTSLRAIRHWLYGIPSQSTDDFLHPKSTLRIGGILQRDDRMLHFERRKGIAKTLRGPDDQILDEHCIRPFLEGVDEELFSTRFAIDHAELRRGGQAIARDGGELAQLLFAAGAGLADVRPLQQQLQQEMAELFKSAHAKNPKINRLLNHIRELKRDIKALQLPSSSYLDMQNAYEAASSRRNSLSEQLASLRAEARRLERWKAAAPKVPLRRMLKRELDELAVLPDLPKQFGEEWRETRRKLAQEEYQRSRTDTQRQEILAQIARLDIPTQLLNHEMEIRRLFERCSAISASKDTRAQDCLKRDKTRASVAARIEEFGSLTASLEDERWRLTTAQRRKLQGLIDEHKRLAERDRWLLQQSASSESKCQSLQHQLQSLAPLPDLSALAATVKSASRQMDLESQLAALRGEVHKLQVQLHSDLERLADWSLGPERLQEISLPELETIDRFDTRWQRIAQDVETAKKAEREHQSKLQSRTKKLEKLVQRGDVPTVQDLDIARQQRDALVQKLLEMPEHTPLAGTSRSKRSSKIKDGASPAGLAFDQSLRDALTFAIRRADEVADRLRGEADRVAEKANLLNEIEELRDACDAQRRRFLESDQHLEDLKKEWERLWHPVGVLPRLPHEMRTWVQYSRQALETYDRLQTKLADLQCRHQWLDTMKQELRSQLNSVVTEPIAADLSLSSLLHLSESWLERLNALHTKRMNIEQEREREQQARNQFLIDRSNLDEQREAWSLEWRQLARELGLPEDWSATAIEDFLETQGQIAAELREIETLSRSIETIDIEQGRFTQDAESLLRLLDIDASLIAGQPVEAWLANLFDRVQRARADQARLETLSSQAEDLDSELRRLSTSIEQLRTRLEFLAKEAACDDWEQIPSIAAAVERREQVHHEIEQLELELLELADGQDLETFCQAVLDVDVSSVVTEQERVNIQIQDCQDDFSAVSEQVGRLRGELDRVDGTSHAADKEMELQSELAELRRAVEAFCQIRLASTLLETAMEAFQEKMQGPVLRLAGDYFSQLTCGSFVGLKLDVDDKGRAVLVGERQGSRQIVGFEGMSEGTCDQLYLSLRLAVIEHFLDTHPPVPFIVDDILITSDDDRAMSAIAALIHLAKKTQVIYFTHHQHLAALAKQRYPEQVAVHVLPAPTPT